LPRGSGRRLAAGRSDLSAGTPYLDHLGRRTPTGQVSAKVSYPSLTHQVNWAAFSKDSLSWQWLAGVLDGLGRLELRPEDLPLGNHAGPPQPARPHSGPLSRLLVRKAGGYLRCPRHRLNLWRLGHRRGWPQPAPRQPLPAAPGWVGGLLEASGYVNLERSNRSYRDAAGQVQLYDYLAPALAIGSRDHRLLAPLRRYFGGELVWPPKSTRRSGACRWRVTNRRQLEQLAEHCGQLPLVGPKVQRLILLPEFYRLREAGAYRTDSPLQPRWEELRRFFGVTRTGEPKKAPESRSLQSRSGSPKKAEASKETPKAALAKPDPALKPESELRPEPGSAAERAQLLCSLGEWGSLELPERPQRRSGNQSSRKPDHFRCPEPRLILESPTPQLPEALQRHFGGRVLGSV
jgi:hypothetical protein